MDILSVFLLTDTAVRIAMASLAGAFLLAIFGLIKQGTKARREG